MPTGYTSDIYNGKKVSFRDYAMYCARAFGALIEMRDSDKDAKIPDKFEPGDHHKKALKESQDKLERVQSISEKEIIAIAKSEYATEVKEYEKQVKRNSDLKSRYEDMLKQARAYQPPSSEHISYKDFMIEQLQSSIKFDCGYKPEMPRLKTVEEWRKENIKSATWSVNYHQEELSKEIERCAGRTLWVKQLKDSLK